MSETEGAIISSELHPQVEAARCIAFCLADAEHGLNIVSHPGLSLDDRLDHVLASAMHEPERISVEHYELLYRLRHGVQQ